MHSVFGFTKYARVCVSFTFTFVFFLHLFVCVQQFCARVYVCLGVSAYANGIVCLEKKICVEFA